MLQIVEEIDVEIGSHAPEVAVLQMKQGASGQLFHFRCRAEQAWFIDDDCDFRRNEAAFRGFECNPPGIGNRLEDTLIVERSAVQVIPVESVSFAPCVNEHFADHGDGFEKGSGVSPVSGAAQESAEIGFIHKYFVMQCIGCQRRADGVRFACAALGVFHCDQVIQLRRCYDPFDAHFAPFEIPCDREEFAVVGGNDFLSAGFFFYGGGIAQYGIGNRIGKRPVELNDIGVLDRIEEKSLR